MFRKTREITYYGYVGFPKFFVLAYSLKNRISSGDYPKGGN